MTTVTERCAFVGARSEPGNRQSGSDPPDHTLWGEVDLGFRIVGYGRNGQRVALWRRSAIGRGVGASDRDGDVERQFGGLRDQGVDCVGRSRQVSASRLAFAWAKTDGKLETLAEHD